MHTYTYSLQNYPQTTIKREYIWTTTSSKECQHHIVHKQYY